MIDSKNAMPDVVLLAGPTASGKSALAISVARQIGGEIVNADSMQVYSELQILSARPAQDEMGGVPHHLFGHISGAQQYDTARWLADATEIILKTLPARPIVLVGGTGLYFSALERGLSELPAIPEEVRSGVRQRFGKVGAEALHAQLKKVDPMAALRIKPHDGQRIQRALEVMEATGRSMFDQPQPEPETLPLHGLSVRRVILEPSRAELHDRISRRFDVMVDAGALAEVEKLLARGLPEDRTVLKAIGVPEFRAHLSGELSLEQAVADAKTATRRYAKRQSTWFRNQMDGRWERIWHPHELNLAE
ncbi:MAG: tRNA (adenosine(37)-N6)-dimethylallyltransferase MiaA [Pseudomonadota bacterium]